VKGGYEIYSTVISFLSFVSAGAHKVPLLDVNSCTFWVKVAEFELEGEGGGISQLVPRTDRTSSTHQISAAVAVQGFSDIEILAPRASR
jgi:hypothetical protein